MQVPEEERKPDQASRNRNTTAPLLRPFGAAVILLTLLHVAMLVVWRPAPVIIPLPWVIPMLTGIMIVIASSVGFLALVRYRVLRDPYSYWTGAGFAAFSVGYVFYLLVWPGLGWQGGSALGHFPSTAAWVSLSVLSILAVFLLAANLSRWPHTAALSGRRWLWLLLACLFLVAVGGVISISLEKCLPELVGANGAFTPLALVWSWGDLFLYALGSFLSVRRHLRTGDTLPGHVS